MDALSGVSLQDRAAVIEETLVLADLHVGQAATAVELPVGAGEAMAERLKTLTAAVDPTVVVVAGDLLHSFQGVPEGVSQTLGVLREVVHEADAELIVIPGNHDTLLDAIWDGQTTPAYRIGETVVTHGHVDPEQPAERYVIGHDHPAITIEGNRRPCYLAGDAVYQDADVLMLPSFNELVAGVPVNNLTGGEFLSPLVTDPDAFAPVVRDDETDETLVFPPLDEFRHRL
ncbi:MAG: putative ICC-like phosphoesterase [halophilic archaeon J07HX5]|nr:MAG: putative ICC-like phosphoesterase [halophilic archaeon J07HX5]